jgi:hypothetical protein
LSYLCFKGFYFQLEAFEPAYAATLSVVARDDCATPPDFAGAKIMKAIRYLPFVGRLLIGLRFAMSGLSKLVAYGPTTEMIGQSACRRRPSWWPLSSSWTVDCC